MLAILFIVAIVLFAVCYKIYGSYMAGIYGLSDENKTPAEAMFDGIDYCPAHPAVLLGHHFASIAGAGPMVGRKPLPCSAGFPLPVVPDRIGVIGGHDMWEPSCRPLAPTANP